MTHQPQRRPSLLTTVSAALLLCVAGQTFLSAEPPKQEPAPSSETNNSEAKRDLPGEKPASKPAEKPALPAPSPSSSEGTLIKRKKPADSTPARGTPTDEAPAEKATKPDDKPLKPESGSPGKSTTPEKSDKVTKREDEALLKSLSTDKDDTEPDDVERLERAINGMREAQQRIEERDAGKKTQDIQTRVVKDLAAIIDALQNPKSPPPDQNSQNQNQDQKNKQKKSGKQRRKLTMMSRRQQAQMRQQQQEQERQRRQQPGAKQDEQPGEKSRDTSGSLAKTKDPKADKDRQQELVKDVWGHLPPNVRAELLNVFSEKYLPKYEDLVRRYYEALAEKNRTRNSGR